MNRRDKISRLTKSITEAERFVVAAREAKQALEMDQLSEMLGTHPASICPEWAAAKRAAIDSSKACHALGRKL